MRLAVGAYSGPRTVCGAVAQLAKNARHVTVAIRRMDDFAFSSLISGGRIQTVGDDSQEVFYAQQLFLQDFGATCVRSRNSRGRAGSNRSNALLRNRWISLLNKVKPTGGSKPPHKADPSSLPSLQASARPVKPA